MRDKFLELYRADGAGIRKFQAIDAAALALADRRPPIIVEAAYDVVQLLATVTILRWHEAAK